jgi:hypothetical protein
MEDNLTIGKEIYFVDFEGISIVYHYFTPHN